jgi:hypothetical protein
MKINGIPVGTSMNPDNISKRIGNTGIYVGSGDMPEGCNVQIDPNGDALNMDDFKDALHLEAGPEHEGMFMRVVNGVATWAKVDSAEGGSF